MKFPSTRSTLLVHEDAEIKINLFVNFDTFKVFIFVSDLFLSYLYLNFILTGVMKKEGDEVEKLVQLCVLIGVGIAKVFHFLSKYVGKKGQYV